jgi:hypothetical protein
VNSKSQRSTLSSGRRGKDSPAPLRAYPSFSLLSSHEITEDLDYLNHRRSPEPQSSRYDSFAPALAPLPGRRYPASPSGLARTGSWFRAVQSSANTARSKG